MIAWSPTAQHEDGCHASATKEVEMQLNDPSVYMKMRG
jgi:hypothetical protein